MYLIRGNKTAAASVAAAVLFLLLFPQRGINEKGGGAMNEVYVSGKVDSISVLHNAAKGKAHLMLHVRVSHQNQRKSHYFRMGSSRSCCLQHD